MPITRRHLAGAGAFIAAMAAGPAAMAQSADEGAVAQAVEKLRPRCSPPTGASSAR